MNYLIDWNVTHSGC